MVALAEHHVGLMGRSRNRLDWARIMRHARQALREVTVQWLEAEAKAQDARGVAS